MMQEPGIMKTFLPRICRSPGDFEVAARDWMLSWGFTDARLTNAGPDGGVDVSASGAIAQVKAWMTPIGIVEVQRLRGAAHDGREAFFFSLMDYTDAARRFADSAGVKLFRFSGYDGTIEATNRGAAVHLEQVGHGTNTGTSIISESQFTEELVKTASEAFDEATRIEGFAILARHKGNRYVQFLPPSRLESVGRRFVDRRNPLTRQELERLVAIGWPLKEEAGEGNFLYPFQKEPDLAELAWIAVRTLVEVHGVQSPDDLTITVESCA